MSTDALGRAIQVVDKTPAGHYSSDAPESVPPVRPEAGLTTEVYALAGLLAEVVELAGNRAMFPGRWEQIAELALEHKSVCAALEAEQTGGSAALHAHTPPLGTEHIIAQLSRPGSAVG